MWRCSLAFLIRTDSAFSSRLSTDSRLPELAAIWHDRMPHSSAADGRIVTG